MSARSDKRQLDDVQRQLSKARESLKILEEQVALWRENLDEVRIKALVSETPLQAREYEEMSRHVQVAEAELGRRQRDVEVLTAKRDELLREWTPE
jgi:chromosome segregation ATPase